MTVAEYLERVTSLPTEDVELPWLADEVHSKFNLNEPWLDETPVIAVLHARVGTRTVAWRRKNLLEADTPEHLGVVAVRDLLSWLEISIADVMSALDLAEPTYYWWKKHPRAIIRPGKAGMVIRVHAVAQAIHDTLGLARLREWWDTNGSAGAVALERSGLVILESSQPEITEFPSFPESAWIDEADAQVEAAQLKRERAGSVDDLDQTDGP